MIIGATSQTTNSSSIIIEYIGQETYWLNVSNYRMQPNNPDRYSFMSLSPSFDEYHHYPGSLQEVSYYVFPNYTGFSSISASFHDECLFPLLVASINKEIFPSITIVTPSSIKIEQAVLGLPGFENPSIGFSKSFFNFPNISSTDKMDAFDQSIRVSDGLTFVDTAAGVYCLFFSPGSKQFSFDVKLDQKISEYNTHLTTDFLDTGIFALVFAVPFNGTHHIHIRPLPTKSSFKFNVTELMNVSIDIDLFQESGHISTPVTSGYIIIDKNQHLIVRIFNKDKYSSAYVSMIITDFSLEKSPSLSGGAIAGIVIGSFAGLTILTMLCIFRNKLFSLCFGDSKNHVKRHKADSPEIIEFATDSQVKNIEIVLPESKEPPALTPKPKNHKRKETESTKKHSKQKLKQKMSKTSLLQAQTTYSRMEIEEHQQGSDTFLESHYYKSQRDGSIYESNSVKNNYSSEKVYNQESYQPIANAHVFTNLNLRDCDVREEAQNIKRSNPDPETPKYSDGGNSLELLTAKDDLPKLSLTQEPRLPFERTKCQEPQPAEDSCTFNQKSNTEQLS